MPSPADQYWIDKILNALETADLDETGIASYIESNQRSTRDLRTLHLDAHLSRMDAAEAADQVDAIIHAHLINLRVFYLPTQNVFSLSQERQEAEASHLLVFQECEELYRKYDAFIQRNSLEDRQNRLREQGIKIFKEKENRKAQTVEAFRALNATEKRHILRSIRHSSFKRDLQMGFAGIQTGKGTTAPSPSDNRAPIDDVVTELDLEQALENWNKENDHVQSLLYPIIYKNYPNQKQTRKGEVRNFIDNLKEQIPQFPEILSTKVLDELNSQFVMDVQTSEHQAFLFHLIHLHNTTSGRKEQPSQMSESLQSFLVNPYQSFFDLIDVQAGHQSFNNESPEFEKIVREVCRDNVITEAEKAFLIEKGREYFIDESRINQLIQDPFMGKATFKIFINQICEDGVITSAERTYITEKSRQYNVSSGTLDEMINIGLTRAKLNAQTTESKTMFSLVILYLTATAFHLEETINNLRWLLGQSDGNADNDKLLNDFLTDFSKEFAHEFESQFFNNGKAQNPSRLRIFSEQNEKNEAQQLLHLLNIEQADFKSAKEAYSKNQVSTGSTKTQIPALNWNITIDPSQERMIKIDYRRKEVSFKERRKEELNHFIELLLNERDNHRSREVDLFLQNFEEFYI